MITQSAFTLYFPVQSGTISTSLESIQPYGTINARRLLVHISTTVYSQILIYIVSELKQCRVNKLAKGFNTVAQDLNPGDSGSQVPGLFNPG